MEAIETRPQSARRSDATIGSWSAPEADLTIEYPRVLLDEIRLAVCSGFHPNPRGDMEAGGAFFGVRENRTVRIAAWRPVADGKNVLELVRVLESAKADPLLNNLAAVGWFFSRPRGGFDLAAEEIGVFDRFFPLPWQFTMMLRPELIGPTRAAFFVRAADGKIPAHDPRREFAIVPLWSPRRAAKAAAARTAPASNPGNSRDGGTDATVPAPTLASYGAAGAAPHSLRRKMSPRKWLWAIPIIAFAALAGLLARDRFLPAPPPAPAPALSLQVQDIRNGELHVAWDRNSPPVRSARRGVLQLSDAGQRRTFTLDGEELRRGSFTYGRRSGDVRVKLSVFGDAGAPAREAAHFVGPMPAESGLEIEIKNLRAQLAMESTRNEQLQTLIRKLRNRIAADQ